LAKANTTINPSAKVPTQVDRDHVIRDFRRFGQVLNDHLRDRKRLVGDSITIAD
jgi:hypothetical protein